MTDPSPLVLVVEDETQMLRFLRTALAAQGYRVVEAATCKEALVAAHVHRVGRRMEDKRTDRGQPGS